MKEKVRKKIYNSFDEIAKHSINTNPMPGTPFEGTMVMSAIVDLRVEMIKDSGLMSNLSGMSSEEYETLVDEVCEEILDKYLKF